MPLFLLGLLTTAALAMPSPSGGAPGQELEGPPTDEIDTVHLIEEAFGRIRALYLHPEAVDPPRMVRAALQQLEHSHESLLVLEEGEEILRIQRGGESATFLTDAADLKEAQLRIDEAIAFAATSGAGEGDPESEPPTVASLQEAALRGLLGTIDRHTRLFTGGRLDEFNTRFKGTLVGIGARIGRRGGKLQILQPFPTAPAGRAGLLAGDHITHVDGVSTTALGVEEVVERIRGPEGVPVVLTVARPGETEARIFVIAREKVLVPTVDSARLPADIGLLSIDHFSQKTSMEFKTHLEQLQEGGRLAGVVVDVRGNTGGSMKQSARIVNSFVSEGTLVQTLGRDGKPVKRLIPRIPAKANRKLFDGPVVVLVDGRTSSGAEIVAGALKFLDRSLTVGSQTFGKGTVQKVYPLRKEEPKASLKLTVGRYFLPGQTFINSVGVTPDVATGTVWLDPNEVTFPDQLREPNALVGHSEPRGGLDGRRNPGGGWETASTGSNAAPKHRLWLPRVLEGWDPKEANELPSGNDDEGGSAPAESSPSDRSASDPPIAELKAGEATDRSPPASPGRAGTAGDAGDDVFNDMELRLAHEILREAAPTDRRGELLGRAGAVVQRWAQEQNARMAGALDLREIPWSEMPPPGWLDRAPAQAETLESRLLGPVPQGLVALLDLPESLHAGAPIDLCLSVRNERQEAIRHLRGILKSSSKLLNGASFLLADLGPGSTRKWCIPTTVPEGVATRWVPWRLYLLDDQGPLGGPVRGKAQFIGHPRPRLHLAVDRSTAPDPEGGVRVTLRVRVRNQGPGPTGNLRLRLGRTDPEDSVERLERFQNSEPLEEGQTGEVELNLRVRDPEAVPQVSVRLRAQDRRSSASTTVSLQLPTQGAAEEEAWSTPATVLLDEPQIDAGRGALVSTGPLPIRGQVQSASGLGSVVVLVGSDQIFSRDFSGSEPPMTLRLDLKAELSEGPNRIRIRAATAEGVERSVTFWVLGIQEPAAAP